MKRPWRVVGIAVLGLTVAVATPLLAATPRARWLAWHAAFARQSEVFIKDDVVWARGHAQALVNARAWDYLLPNADREPDDRVLFRALVIELAANEEVPDDALSVVVKATRSERIDLRGAAFRALRIRQDPRTILALSEIAGSLHYTYVRDLVENWGYVAPRESPDDMSALRAWVSTNRDKLPPQIR